ncbi:MAG: arsenate reductase ArsC [Deltaproteobacteria bacterium]|nr:arsenate reductase ArsC [Deltaproteobacteria bacterium]
MDAPSKQTAIKVLFVCTHNSGRSQMAEAFLNVVGQGRFFAESAGLQPREINPLVAEAMREQGIDLSTKRAKKIFDFFKEGKLYDYVVYVCDKETEAQCPVFPGVRKTLHWPFPDPAALEGSPAEKLAKVREIRNQVKRRVEQFVNNFPSQLSR